MKFTVFAVFLFSIGWMSAEVAGDDRPADCCLSVKSTKIPFENILFYSMQEEMPCKIRAVRFCTKKYITICSDPENDWAKKVMRILDKKRATKSSPKPTMCQACTTNMIPTVTTTNKTLVTKTETSTCTIVPPTVTTIKTSGPEISTSTTVPKTVTAIITSRLETKISKTTIQPASVSKENPKSTAIRYGTDTGRPVDCCNELKNTRMPVENIVDYDMQEITLLCYVRAVRFHTKKNKVICSDPNSSWAKSVMKKVNKRTTTKPSQKPTMGYTNTTNAITCGTSETTAPPITTTITRMTKTIKKMSKMMIRKKGKKSKKTIGMSGPEASTSTPVPPIVTTIETSGPEASTSTPVPPIVTTIETSGPEASTSTPVPPIVLTIETSGPEASTSTPVPPIVTTIKTSGPEASTSTPVPPIVATIETPGLETETSKTTTQPTSLSKDNPESSLSTAITFQMGETVTYGIFVTSSTTKDCCLVVTKNKPAFHEIVDYRVQETPHCFVRAVLFITVENNMICSSPVEDWVQDYVQNLNRRRITTEQTDRREFAVTRIKPLDQNQRQPIETTEIFQLDGLSKVEKKQLESLVTSVPFEMHDRYKNINNYFCLKKEPAKYFCIKQP